MSPSKADAEIHAMQEALAALASLDQPEQQRVLNWLANKLNLSSPAAPEMHSTILASGGPVVLPIGEGAASPKVFVGRKRPATDVERIACLAYYLPHFRDTPRFNAKDLASLNTEAAQPKIGDIARAVNNAAYQNRFISQAGSGKKQITVIGEAVVEALPDRDKVKEAFEAHAAVARRKSKPKRKARQ